MDKIAERFNPADPQSVELHGSPMYHGRRFWRTISRQDRMTAMTDALKVFASSHPSNRMFGCAIRKSLVINKDPVELAFEQLASRFDMFLKRLYHEKGNNQRGLIIFDKSKYETTLQTLAIDFRKIGHSWGVLKTLAEVPMFVDSRASRLIQLSDLGAYSLFRYYEEGDDQLYSIIAKSWIVRENRKTF